MSIEDEETKIEEIKLSDGMKHRMQSYFSQMRLSHIQMSDIKSMIDARNKTLLGETKELLAEATKIINNDFKVEAKRIYDKMDIHETKISDRLKMHEDEDVKHRLSFGQRIAMMEQTIKDAYWLIPLVITSIFAVVQLIISWVKK